MIENDEKMVDTTTTIFVLGAHESTNTHFVTNVDCKNATPNTLAEFVTTKSADDSSQDTGRQLG